MMTRTSRPSCRRAGGSAPATSAKPPTLANGAASAVTKRTRISSVCSRPVVQAARTGTAGGAPVREELRLLLVLHTSGCHDRRAGRLGRGWISSEQRPGLLRCSSGRRSDGAGGGEHVRRAVEPRAYTPQELMVAA